MSATAPAHVSSRQSQPDVGVPDAYATRLAAAQDLLERGQAATAERHAAALCQEHPTQPAAYVLYARCAGAQGDWPEAVRRWRASAARFPAAPEKSHMGLAHALLHTDLAAAEAAFSTVLAINPNHPGALAGLAQAVSAATPKRGIDLWRSAIALAGERALPAWRVALARLLLAQGGADEAETIARAILKRAPRNRPATGLLRQILVETNNKALAAQELENGHFSLSAGAAPADRMPLQMWLGDIHAARASFAAALEAATDVPELAALFPAIPRNFELYDRREIWRTLRVRIRGAAPNSNPLAACLALRLDLALRDYDSFLHHYAAAPPLAEPWAARLRRQAVILQAPAFPDFRAPKVFGIGLTKTGTTSLGRALETLGYLQAHFVNPFTEEIIGEEDFPLFDAVTDCPASLRFETLYHTYPNAKFILTERPRPDWELSFESHFARSDGSFAAFREKAVRRNQFRHGAALAQLHGGLYLAHQDPPTAMQAFTDRVDAFFATKPPTKLLRHSVFTGDGWPQLCAFLQQPHPTTPYPWTNKSSSLASANPL